MNIKTTLFIASAFIASCAAEGDDRLDQEPEHSAATKAPGDEGADLESTSQSLIFGSDDVGVIKAANASCPFGLGPSQLFLDGENTNNNNQRSGWIGDTISNSNTTFQICVVPGANFRPIRSANSNNNYAVLRMGPNCPSGAVPFSRYFDGNDGSTNWCETSDDGGNGSCWGNLVLDFCLFRANPSAASFSFANFGTTYGVFASAGMAGTLDSGFVYTDDEDSNNNDSITGDYSGSGAFLQTSFSHGGTKLFMSRVQ